MNDLDAIKYLSSLKGVGTWTAEIILIFALERPNILSYNDLSIRRGITILHNTNQLTASMFKYYSRLYSPYGTIAGFYLWNVKGPTNFKNNCNKYKKSKQTNLPFAYFLYLYNDGSRI